MAKSTYSVKITDVTVTPSALPASVLKFAEKKISLETYNYVMEVKYGTDTWVIARKYNEFKSFYKQLSTRFGFTADYFPTEFALKVEESMITKRKESFNRFLEEVAKNQIITDSNTWKLFIGETAPRTNTSNNSQSSTQSTSSKSASSSNSNASNNNNFYQPPPAQTQSAPQPAPQPQPQPQPQYHQQPQHHQQPQPQYQQQQQQGQPQVINLGNLLDMAKQMQQAMQQPGFIQPQYIPPPQQQQQQPQHQPPMYDPPQQSSQPPQTQANYQPPPSIPYESAPAHPSSGGAHASTSGAESNTIISDLMDLTQLPPDFWNVYAKAKVPSGSLGPFQSYQNKYIPVFILLEETINAEVSYRCPVKVFGLTGFSTQEHRRYQLYHHDGSEETWVELFHCKPLFGGLPTYVGIGNARLPSQLGNRIAQLQQVHTELQKAQKDWEGQL